MPKDSEKQRNKYNKGRVRRLWNLCKHCHWCGKETVLQASGTGYSKPDTATFDHLYHRSDPKRKQHPHSGVLACYECNQRRGREAYIKTLPLWNQWIIAIKLHKPLYHVKKVVYAFARKRGYIE